MELQKIEEVVLRLNRTLDELAETWALLGSEFIKASEVTLRHSEALERLLTGNGMTVNTKVFQEQTLALIGPMSRDEDDAS